MGTLSPSKAVYTLFGEFGITMLATYWRRLKKSWKCIILAQACKHVTSKNRISGRKQTNKIEVIREVSEVDRSATKKLPTKKTE